MTSCWRIINNWIDRRPGSWQNLSPGLCLYYVWSWGVRTGRYHDTAEARWHFFDCAVVYRGMNRGRRDFLTNCGLTEVFSFYLLAVLGPQCPEAQNGSMCLKQGPSNRGEVREREAEGVGGIENKNHAMPAVKKRVQSASQLFHSPSLAESPQLPAASPDLCHPSLAAALISHHPLGAPHGCKQMQFCISCSLDTTEAPALTQCLGENKPSISVKQLKW